MPRTAPPPPKRTRRDLVEQFVAAPPVGPALEIDEANGIIKRVKVLGRFSRNSHGVREAENGTEYTRGCMESAIPMYEGAKVKANHPPDRSRPAAEREIGATIGVLRNARIESDERGDPAVWADLHYMPSHKDVPCLLDDVKKRLGVYGLSHNAAAAKERIDRAAKRLVIESLATVRSVDLVDKPATNRNLWESHDVSQTTTLRDILESQRKRFSKKRLGHMDRLLELDAMGDAIGADVEEVPAETDPDEALKTGFRAAMMAVIDSDTDAAAKIKKLKELLTTHEKLSAKDEPEEVAEEEEDEEEDDKSVTESAELKQLRAEKRVRELCESLDFAPSALQVESLVGLGDDAKRRKLVESFRQTTTPAKPPAKTPKSAPPGGVPPAKKPPRDLAESEVETDLNMLRAG